MIYTEHITATLFSMTQSALKFKASDLRLDTDLRAFTWNWLLTGGKRFENHNTMTLSQLRIVLED